MYAAVFNAFVGSSSTGARLTPSSPGGVAYVAHLFGFVFGLLVGLVVRAASTAPRPPPQPARLR